MGVTRTEDDVGTEDTVWLVVIVAVADGTFCDFCRGGCDKNGYLLGAFFKTEDGGGGVLLVVLAITALLDVPVFGFAVVAVVVVVV